MNSLIGHYIIHSFLIIARISLSYSAEITEIYLHFFDNKFRESNLFIPMYYTNEAAFKKLISRNIFSVWVNFLVFHTVYFLIVQII